MIVQDFYIPKYDWIVKVYYAVTAYWTSDILCALHRIGCRGEDFKQAYRNLSSGVLNTGLTYSNFEDRETVMVIALTSSPGEFQNSWENERERIGKRIAELRKKKGISQAKLSELTGIGSGHIARIELGKYSTGVDLLSKIANALDYKLDFVKDK